MCHCRREFLFCWSSKSTHAWHSHHLIRLLLLSRVLNTATFEFFLLFPQDWPCRYCFLIKSEYEVCDWFANCVIGVIGHLVAANGPFSALKALGVQKTFKDLNFGVFFCIVVPAALDYRLCQKELLINNNGWGRWFFWWLLLLVQFLLHLNSMCSEERLVIFIDEPLTSVMNIIVIVLQCKRTPLYVIEARESLIHLINNRHLEKLRFTHREKVNLLAFINDQFLFRLSLLFLIQVKAYGLVHRYIVLLAVIKVNLVYNCKELG